MIVGLTGRAQSGKSTLARALGWTELSFAARLKTEVRNMALQMEPALFDACVLAEAGNVMAKKRIRPWYIFWGEFRRDMDADYWLRPVMERVKASPETQFVISDVRYLNEARAIKDAGGVIVRLTRATEIPDIPTETVSLQEIEDAGLVDVRIDNNGTVEDMVRQLNSRND